MDQKTIDREPVKIGFIEDLSGDLSIYGISKWHAAQLAVKEINAGFKLAGGHMGASGLGILGQYASMPPLVKTRGAELLFIDRGGEKDNVKLLFAEEDKILVRSGKKASSAGMSSCSPWMVDRILRSGNRWLIA